MGVERLAHFRMYNIILLTLRVALVSLVLVSCIQRSTIEEASIASFLEAAAVRPEYVGAGLIEEKTLLLITVHGNLIEMDDLARSKLPPGTRYEIRELTHSLAELRALADRIVAEQLGGSTANHNVTLVDVDELRGVVVVGLERLDDEITKDLLKTYGAPIVFEQHDRISFF